MSFFFLGEEILNSKWHLFQIESNIWMDPKEPDSFIIL